MVQGSGDKDLWRKCRWVQRDGFSSLVPLDGSSVTLMAKASQGSLREIDAVALFVLCLIEESDISDSCERETSIQVEVKRLDYGDTACLSLCSVKEIVPDMASLPLQAVQVSLANVSIFSVGTFATITHAKSSHPDQNHLNYLSYVWRKLLNSVDGRQEFIF